MQSCRGGPTHIEYLVSGSQSRAKVIFPFNFLFMNPLTTAKEEHVWLLFSELGAVQPALDKTRFCPCCGFYVSVYESSKE